jgi:YaiO family outer membrane protein
VTARRIAEALALAALLPAAAQAQTAPTSREAAIAEARAALAREDSAAAIATLERARDAHPEDAEILRLLGSSYAFARRYDAAIATLERARTLAPADLDIRAALARAYLWSGRRGDAARELEAIEARDPANAEIGAIRAQLAAPAAQEERRARGAGIAIAQSIAGVELDSGTERTWWTTTLGVFGDIAEGATLSAEIEREDREVAIDTRMLARLDYRFSPQWRGYVAAGGTPNADFRERWSVRGGVEGEVIGNLSLGADLRHADYGNANITALEPTARLRVPALGGSATVRMINLWDETGTHRSGWSGRLDTELDDGSLLFAGAATYPDTEAGITRRVRSVFLGAALPVAERVMLRATGEYERRVDSYTRKSLTLGLQLRL